MGNLCLQSVSPDKKSWIWILNPEFWGEASSQWAQKFLPCVRVCSGTIVLGTMRITPAVFQEQQVQCRWGVGEGPYNAEEPTQGIHKESRCSSTGTHIPDPRDWVLQKAHPLPSQYLHFSLGDPEQRPQLILAGAPASKTGPPRIEFCYAAQRWNSLVLCSHCLWAVSIIQALCFLLSLICHNHWVLISVP